MIVGPRKRWLDGIAEFCLLLSSHCYRVVAQCRGFLFLSCAVLVACVIVIFALSDNTVLSYKPRGIFFFFFAFVLYDHFFKITLCDMFDLCQERVYVAHWFGRPLNV